MKDVANKIALLRTFGTKEEIARFEEFKKSTIITMMQMEKSTQILLKKLNKHHENTMRHNIMVAHDVKYIAEQLGEPPESVQNLFIAALLHDIGKLNIMDILLSASEHDETTMVKMKREENPNDLRLMKKKLIPIDVLTVSDFLKYKKRLDDDFNEKEYILFIKRHNVNPEWTLREYLQTHQEHTREILRSAGLPDNIVEYAASHHPEYFEDGRELAWQCYILEIADRFNAMIQSEGMRTYASKFNRITALDVIIESLRKRFGKGIMETVRKKKSNEIIKVIGRKYIPYEINHTLIPLAEGIAAGSISSGNITPDDMKRTVEILSDIETTFYLNRRIPGLLSKELFNHLQSIERKLVTLSRRRKSA